MCKDKSVRYLVIGVSATTTIPVSGVHNGERCGTFYDEHGHPTGTHCCPEGQHWEYGTEGGAPGEHWHCEPGNEK